jgi:actin-related protein 8
MILDDIEAIISTVLKERLDVRRPDYKVCCLLPLFIIGVKHDHHQDYSVVLVIPDFYDRAYVRDFVNIILVSLGFKQICVQQASQAYLC